MKCVLAYTDTILDERILEPWILKVLLVGSFSNLNVATIKQNGMSVYNSQ